MPDTVTDKAIARREMVDICRRMNSSGINQGTAGNLSMRCEDGFLITPSSLPYDMMQPDDIVEMDFQGTYVGRRPSSEWRFHRDILRERQDIDVVLHCHSLYATTLASRPRLRARRSRSRRRLATWGRELRSSS